MAWNKTKCSLLQQCVTLHDYKLASGLGKRKDGRPYVNVHGLFGSDAVTLRLMME